MPVRRSLVNSVASLKSPRGLKYVMNWSSSTLRGIMLPMAVPVALTLGLPPTPFIAAVLSGGIFGDHASPISDTTIVSSLASASDHIEHVRTQIPYALLAGSVAIAAFALTGAWLAL